MYPSVPRSRSSVGASTSAASAANANQPPSELRLTPAAASSETGGSPVQASTFTGRSADSTTERTSSLRVSRGA